MSRQVMTKLIEDKDRKAKHFLTGCHAAYTKLLEVRAQFTSPMGVQILAKMREID